MDINKVRIGEDAAVEIAIDSGLILRVDASAQDFSRIEMWASNPFPSVTVTNGDSTPLVVAITVWNVDRGATTTVTQAGLASDAARTRACAAVDLGATTIIASETTVSANGSLRHLFVVPACATVGLRTGHPAERDGANIALVGDLQRAFSSLDELSGLIGPTGFDAQQTIFLGSTSFAESQGAFDRLLDRVCPDYPECQDGLGMPFSVTLGEVDTVHSSTFRSTFGQSTLVGQIGDLRVLMLDTANGTAAADQMARVRAITPGGPPGVVFTNRVALPAALTSDRGFASEQEALELHELLVTRNFRWYVAAGRGSGEDRRFGDIRIIEVPALSSGEYTEARLLRAHTGLATCDFVDVCPAGQVCGDGFCYAACSGDLDCAGLERTCDRIVGYCRYSCSADSDCPTSSPTCLLGIGFCEESPRLEFSRAQLAP